MEPIYIPPLQFHHTPIPTPRPTDSDDISTATDTSESLPVNEKKVQSSDFLIKLQTVLSERNEADVLKRRGGYFLSLESDGYLSWKPISNTFTLNPLALVQERSKTKTLLGSILSKFISRSKDRDTPDSKMYVDLFDKLMEIPLLCDCLKKNKSLKDQWTQFINKLLFGKLTTNAEALRNFLLSTKYDIPILIAFLKKSQKVIIAENRNSNSDELIALLGYESLFGGLSEEEKNEKLKRTINNPDDVLLPTPRISLISYDELFHMCIHAILPFLLKQREIENDLEAYIKNLKPQKSNLIFLHEQKVEKVEMLKKKATEAYNQMELGLCLSMLQQEYVLGLTNCMEYVECTLRYIIDRSAENLCKQNCLSQEAVQEIQNTVKAALKNQEGAVRDLNLCLDVVKVKIRDLAKLAAV